MNLDDSSTDSRRTTWQDPDMAAAEEELDEFLRTGRNEKKSSGQGQQSYQHSHQQQAGQGASAADLAVRQAYLVLELTPGTPWEKVKDQHKKLLLKHHPDRHSGNPKAQAEATATTQRINEAFQKIKKHLGQ